MRKTRPEPHFSCVDTRTDWKGLLPGDKAAIGNTEVEVAGLVLGPAGVYLLLTATQPIPVGLNFQLGCDGKSMSGTVDYCEFKEGRYLMGVEVQCGSMSVAMAS